jgi:hypothetical protein
MRTRRLLGSLLTLGLLLPATTSAQDKPPTPPKADDKPAMPGEGEMSPEMKAAMEAMQPGPAHAKLAKLAGEWTTSAKLAMAGAPGEETAGTSKITVVMGGRFIHEESAGMMHGMQYQSAKLMGYNNGSKKYEAVWTYTMGTGMMTMTGASTDDGKTITFNAAWDNEIGVKETATITYKMTDDDHFTVTLAAGDMPDGSAGPKMEVVYTRKK